MSRLMLCGIVSWLVLASPRSGRADDAEDKAVAFVEKLGGWITRDQKLPDKPVTEVDLQFTKVTDVGLKVLTPLKNLSTLYLYGTQVTDAGLKELAPLKKLTTLDLAEARKVTDAGLKKLAPLKNLTTLYLGGTQVTDAGLKELAPLKNLTTLYLNGTQVTDAGLKEHLLGLAQVDLFASPRQVRRVRFAPVPFPLGHQHLGFGNHRRDRRRRGLVRPIAGEVVEEGRTFDPLTLTAEVHLHQFGDVVLLLLDGAAQFGNQCEEFLDLSVEPCVVRELLSEVLAKREEFGFG